MNKKRLWASAALVCALMTPAAQAASLPQRTSVPAHFETAWEQLLEQFGIQKPAGGTTSKPDSNGGNTNGGVNGGTNQEGSGSGTATRPPRPRRRSCPASTRRGRKMGCLR